jgi:GT2 family glycosyltransferase
METFNILIVNYNNYAYTIECLESIYKTIKKCNNIKIRICVVDNSDVYQEDNLMTQWCNGKLEKIDTSFPQYVYPLEDKPISYKLLNEEEIYNKELLDNVSLIFLRQHNNNGFASANNLGIKFLMMYDDWKWIWLLNNDTVIETESLKNAITYLSGIEDQKIGLVGSKLFYYNDPEKIQGIGVVYNKFFSTIKSIGKNEKDKSIYEQYDYNGKISYPIGASLFVCKQFLLDVGLMSEEFFLYYEELDWVLRGKANNWKLGFANNVHVYHKEGASISEGELKYSSLLADKCSIVNRVKIAKKYYPYTTPTILLSVFLTISNRIRRKQYNRIGPLLKSLFKLKI